MFLRAVDGKARFTELTFQTRYHNTCKLSLIERVMQHNLSSLVRFFLTDSLLRTATVYSAWFRFYFLANNILIN